MPSARYRSSRPFSFALIQALWPIWMWVTVPMHVPCSLGRACVVIGQVLSSIPVHKGTGNPFLVVVIGLPCRRRREDVTIPHVADGETSEPPPFFSVFWFFSCFFFFVFS
ncbi:hypothetical protein GGS26DRAFT_554609 [Hypomontagnella submonticulosa]|nr:hypothetical protein GGS26DRAFT_554609 [Hypomontagnella submonticulosa]